AMMEHLGGAESTEKIAERQQRYLNLPEGEAMFKIVTGDGEAVGSVGYWITEHLDEPVYETGWVRLPAFQGRGVAASSPRQAIERAAAEKRNRWLHAFPSVTNPASNAICRKLGFELVEEGTEFEYPKGHLLVVNNWRLDLADFGGQDI